MRFTLALVLRSMRWLPPFLVLMVWNLLVLSDPGEALSAVSALVPAFLIWSTWTTVVTGSIDDDPHHDLLAAAAGSVDRLHRARALAVLASGLGLSFMAAWAVALSAVPTPGCSRLVSALAALATMMAGVLAGTGIGTLLHRPLVRHRAASTLAGLGGVIIVMLLPPVQALLRALSQGRVAAALVMIAAAAVWAAGAGLVASRVAGIRSR